MSDNKNFGSKVFQEYDNKYEGKYQTIFVLRTDENGDEIKLAYFEDYVRILAEYKIGHKISIEPETCEYGIKMYLYDDKRYKSKPNIYTVKIETTNSNNMLFIDKIIIDMLNKKIIDYTYDFVLDDISEYFENIFRE